MTMLNLKNKSKKFFIIATIFIVSFLFLNVNLSAVGAQGSSDSKDKFGLEATAGKAGLKTDGEARTPEVLAGEIIGFVLSFIGIVFFVLMVYGGMIWLTARGNEQRVDKAKEIIISASIGLAIIFLSYGVTNVIIARFAG